MSPAETAGARRLARMRESGYEAGRSYGDFLAELFGYLEIDPKKFRRAARKVAPLLTGEELRGLVQIGRDVPATPGDFEDRFEEVCAGRSAEERRELMRLWLRYL